MSYQIRKIRVDVAVTLVNMPVLKGALFISENDMSYMGTPRLEDFLNQEGERFFPFMHEDGTYSLLHKKQVLFLSSSEQDLKALKDDLLITPKDVEVAFAENQRLRGQIYPNLPKETLRVSDFFNQKDLFLSMYQGENKFVINTAHILYVKD